MRTYELTTFCLMYVLAVATPGPGVAAIIARALARGTHGAPAFIAGFVVGDLVWLVLTALGLAALAETAHAAFTVVRYLGALYLAFLACQLWILRARPITSAVTPPAQSNARAFLASLSLTLGNPKAMVFFLAILPAFIRLESLKLASLATLAAVIVTAQPLVLGSYALAAARAQRLLRDPATLRTLHRLTAVLLFTAAVLVALRS